MVLKPEGGPESALSKRLVKGLVKTQTAGPHPLEILFQEVSGRGPEFPFLTDFPNDSDSTSLGSTQ